MNVVEGDVFRRRCDPDLVRGKYSRLSLKRMRRKRRDFWFAFLLWQRFGARAKEKSF